jgi:hypothetical protein
MEWGAVSGVSWKNSRLARRAVPPGAYFRDLCGSKELDPNEIPGRSHLPARRFEVDSNTYTRIVCRGEAI